MAKFEVNSFFKYQTYDNVTFASKASRFFAPNNIAKLNERKKMCPENKMKENCDRVLCAAERTKQKMGKICMQ